MNLRRCDRCGVISSRKNPADSFILLHDIQRYACHELCPACYEAFKAWLAPSPSRDIAPVVNEGPPA